MLQKYDILYEYDNSDRLRVWWMERLEDSYRTVSGLQDGEKVISGWKLAKPKNIGKANATNGVQQAEAEIVSLYQKKIDRGASRGIPDVNSASKYFEPMLAAKYEGFTSTCYSQPKLDGVRCIVKKDGMWSRNGKPIISSPHIFEELKFVFDEYPNLVFDGELYNHDLKADFDKIISLVKKTKPTPIDIMEAADLVEYHIYDCKLLPFMTFRDRQELLWALLDTKTLNKIKRLKTDQVFTQEELDTLYAEYLTDGYEGQMVRNDTPYEHKRTKNLLKRKEFLDREFEIVDILEGQGNWAGYAKVTVVRLEDGRTCESGMRGNQAYLKKVLEEKDKYIGKLAKVRFQNYTPDGKLRFPVVVELDRTM